MKIQLLCRSEQLLRAVLWGLGGATRLLQPWSAAMSLTGPFLTWSPQSLPQCCCRVLVCALGQSCWAQPCHWGTTWAGPGPGSPPRADPIPAPGLGRLLALSIAWQEHRNLHLKKIPKYSQSCSENIYWPSVEVLLQTNSLVASLLFLSTSTAMCANTSSPSLSGRWVTFEGLPVMASSVLTGCAFFLSLGMEGRPRSCAPGWAGRLNASFFLEKNRNLCALKSWCLKGVLPRREHKSDWSH